jgi:peptidyl-prolyl cis-trans isomerase D
MFDLFRSRAKAVRYLLGAILLVVALSMVITLIPGFGSTTSSDDGVLARVGKDVISVMDVQTAMRNVQRRGTIPPEMLQHMVPQVIDQLITERAVAFQAQRMGMEVTEQDLANGIRSLVPQLFQNGQFVGREAYAAFLSEQNLSIEQFEATVARQVLLERIRSVALQAVLVSPQEIELAFRLRNEKAKIDYVKLTMDEVAAQVKPTQEQLREFFAKSPGSFRMEEKRSLDLLVVDQAKLEASITIPDSELEQVYKSSPDRFRSPDRVKVRHILVATSDKPKEEEPKLKAKAEGLLKQLKAGADFAKLARENSDDPGSKEKGGDLDWVVRNQTVPEFEKAAFELKPNELSGLIKTTYGYHILQVLEKQNARMPAFAEVKDKLAAEMKRQQVAEKMQTLGDAAEAELRKNPRHPEQVASALNLTLTKAEKIVPGDPIPEVGANKEFTEMAFAAQKGDVLQQVPLGGNRIVVAVVTDVFPARPAEFAEAEAQVLARYKAVEANRIVLQKSDELGAKARQMNDLRKAAQALGLTVKTSEEFTRNGAIEGVGSAAFLDQAFKQPVGSIIGPVSVSDVRVVYRVAAHVEPDPSQLAAQRDSIRDELKTRKARERNMLFEDSIKEALQREGKIKVNRNAMDRLVASYRG